MNNSSLGGGSALGPDDHNSNPDLTYAFAVGKTQAVAYLTPAGVEQRIEPNAWKMRRKVTSDDYRNDALIQSKRETDDTSNYRALDLNPTNNAPSSPNTIYDVDFPGCPAIQENGLDIALDEAYNNFFAYIEVELSGTQRCSDVVPWSYRAKLNVNATPSVVANELRGRSLNLPFNRIP